VGLGYDEAAFRIAWLIREGLTRELTGVDLNDESGGGKFGLVDASNRHDKSEA
jgi:ethanolamine ammonia-lyase small subunit